MAFSVNPESCPLALLVSLGLCFFGKGDSFSWLHKEILCGQSVLLMPIESILRNRKIRHLDLAPLVCVEADSSLEEVVAAMRSQQVGCVLVMERHKLAGIFTERDLMTKVIGSPVEY